MRYTHIAFDIDGTLIDTQDTFTYSFAKTIGEIKGMDVLPTIWCSTLACPVWWA